MKSKTVAILVVILCVCMVLAALALIVWNMPKSDTPALFISTSMPPHSPMTVSCSAMT